MKKQLLNSNWIMKRVSDGTEYSTTVPSSVYSTLHENSIIPEPYWKDNEDTVLKVMEETFEYKCSFYPNDEVIKEENLILCFEGIDTIASVYLNDILLADVANMHRKWEFPVTDILKKGENIIEISLFSPLKHAAKAFAECPTRGTEDAWEGFSHIRKAHCMYGWDWGAHLPDAGIFRDVYIKAFSKASIDSCYIEQIHNKNSVRLLLSPTFQANDLKTDHLVSDLGNDYSYAITIKEPDGNELIFPDSPAEIKLENPELWWPNGLGSQALYTIKCDLLFQGNLIDSWSRRIGLRTLTMRVEKDEWGESFAHEINGKTVFAMGADYIPEEHILPRKTRERTTQLLEDCKLANFNSIRVWGGGYYPDDYFFDLCDELGFIVWQDFMFACSVYELTPDFEANITQEFIDNIKRIRHHACLGLWCGNNEMESFVKDGEWVSKPSEVRDYLFMYERIIPQVLSKYDPATFYWPSSPSSGGAFDKPQSPDHGDVHFWEVWHGNKPFSEYRKHKFRYLSEFGFQAIPSVKTIEQGITDDPQDLNLFSYVMEKHQRHGSANGKIMNYLQQTYKYPYNFSDMVYASQLLQADAIRYGVEHFRRNRGRCMGAVYWQLNDCWPVISWSSIDYYNRWKALHYYAKRFFAPIMISCEEQNWMTAKADFNRQHFNFEKSIHLNIANETIYEKNLVISWALRNADASVVREESQEVSVPALSAIWLEKIYLPEAELLSQYVSYEIQDSSQTEKDPGTNNGLISAGTVLFTYPKYFKFTDPQLTFEIEDNDIIVKAQAFAKNVEILNENEDLILSDNYFDMNAGIFKVSILRGEANNLRIRSVYDIGKV